MFYEHDMFLALVSLGPRRILHTDDVFNVDEAKTIRIGQVIHYMTFFGARSSYTHDSVVFDLA